jgi:hypothetical protein
LHLVKQSGHALRLLGEEVCVIGFDLLGEETRFNAGFVDAELVEANKRGVDVLILLAVVIEKVANGNLIGLGYLSLVFGFVPGSELQDEDDLRKLGQFLAGIVAKVLIAINDPSRLSHSQSAVSVFESRLSDRLKRSLEFTIDSFLTPSLSPPGDSRLSSPGNNGLHQMAPILTSANRPPD